MSIHPSLKIDLASTQQRSVLSRIERIKDLMKKGLWKEGQAVVGLPKSKMVRIKAKKKAKAAEGTEDAAAAPAVAGASTVPTPAAAAAAPAQKPKAKG